MNVELYHEEGMEDIDPQDIASYNEVMEAIIEHNLAQRREATRGSIPASIPALTTPAEADLPEPALPDYEIDTSDRDRYGYALITLDW